MAGLREMGAFALKIPTQYGGLGFSQVNYNRVIHLISSYCGSTAALYLHIKVSECHSRFCCSAPRSKKEISAPIQKRGYFSFALTEPGPARTHV